ncbi:MAG TPA: hypothetical protein VM686_16725 [Polyangiaceae bacterium]|nr:hypothetical protein [Polyangiaceae bacterium]
MGKIEPRCIVISLLLGSACTGGEESHASDVETGGDGGVEAETMAADPACPDPSEVIDPTAVIDDMEDTNPNVLRIGDRTGAWWTASDETPGGTLVPPFGGPASPEALPEPRCGSQYAMHITGQGYNEWGAMLGLSFVYDPAGTVFYDASAWEGITFWARIGDTSTNQVRFAITDVTSDPAGGVCVEDGPPGEACYDTFGVPLMGLDVVWKRYKIPFRGLSQRGFGIQAEAVESSQLNNLNFNFEPGAIFDLSIDDIAFY